MTVICRPIRVDCVKCEAQNKKPLKIPAIRLT